MDDHAIHQCQCPACLSDADHSERLLHEQMNLLLQRLDEQERRWVAGLESKKIGYGGDTAVARITGLHVDPDQSAFARQPAACESGSP